MRYAVQSRYSMMSRQNESIFPVLEELGIGFVAFTPLANGYRSGKYDKHSRFEDSEENRIDYRSFLPQFKAENMKANQVLFDLINQYANEKNATTAQIALAWVLAQKPYIIPIPGTRKSDRLIENAGSAEIDFSVEELNKMNEALSNMKIVGEYFGPRTK